MRRRTRPAARSHAYTQNPRKRNDPAKIAPYSSVCPSPAGVGICHVCRSAAHPAASAHMATRKTATNARAFTQRPTSSVCWCPGRRTDAGRGGLPPSPPILQLPEQPQGEDDQRDVHNEERVALDDGDGEQNQGGERQEVDHGDGSDDGEE